MEFGILGPLSVRRGGDELPLGPPKQRALLAVLILRRNELVPTATLVDELWGERPPPTAVKAVQVYISRLRKALGEGLLESAPLGYVLRLGDASLDLLEFERLLADGRRRLREADAAGAGEVLRRALGLWRGPALADFRYEAFARDEIGRLEELRLIALEQRLESDLALGRHDEAVPELEALVREHPLRERLRGLLMLALYRSGRQADALAAYKDARAALVEELGLDPSESLRRLEAGILRHDPSLDLVVLAPTPAGPAAAGEPAPTPPGSRRRRVATIAGGVVAVAAATGATVVLLTRGGPGPAVAAEVNVDSVGILDPQSGHLTRQVPVGTSPGAVAFGEGSIWVANVDAHTVSMIDPTTHATQTIQVGNGPAAVAVCGRFVWVANALDGTLSKIDPLTETQVDLVRVGNRPTGVACGERALWVANAGDDTVLRLDPRTGARLATIAVSAGADGIATGAGSVWVTSGSRRRVTRIDPSSGDVAEPIDVGSGAAAIAVGAGGVWVANRDDGTVSLIDPASNTVRAAIPVGDSPNGIAVAGDSVWVSNEFDGTLSRIDPARLAVVETAPTGNRPEGVASVEGKLYVAVRASGAGHTGGTLAVFEEPVLETAGFESIDPAGAFTPPAEGVLILTNDGLTGYRRVGGSEGAQLVPDLAVSIPTATHGGRSYTFRLRPGIRYSTGARLRPEDFRRALERTLTFPGGGYAQTFAGIVGAAACVESPKHCDLSRGVVTNAAARTVTFHLTAPDADFPHKLALPAASAVPPDTPLRVRLGVPATGPYTIASYDPKRSLRLVRNPYFHEWSRAAQPAGYPDVILWRFGKADANALAVEHDRGDVATSLGVYKAPSAAIVSTLRTQYASRVRINPAQATSFIDLNTRRPPFDDVRVRQAVNLAIDRARMVALSGGSAVAQATCQVLPPNFPAYRPYCPYERDLAKARRLVQASGTKGQIVTVLGDGRAATHPGAHLAAVLRSLGYRARYRLDPLAFFHASKVEAAEEGWIADYFSPGAMFRRTLACAGDANTGSFCDKAIDREVARALSLQASDPEAAREAWAEVDRHVVDRAPWIAYANPVVFDFLSSRVGHYQFNPQWGPLIDQLWVK